MTTNQIPSFTESILRFREDDLEFRTITTLLYILGCRDEQEPERNPLAPRLQRHLKLLASVSSMLVMNHEVIAIVSKRCTTGLTLFIVPEPNPDPDTVDVDEVEDPNAHHLCSSLHLVIKNPRVKEIGSVILMDIPEVRIGDDIFQFIVINWKQSFEAHSQAIARLIAASHSGGEKEWLRLAHYSLFQSAAKAARRIVADNFFELLTTLPANDVDYRILTDFPGLTKLDQLHIGGLFEDDVDLAEHFPLLGQFVESETVRIPADLVSFLREFHSFFSVLLRESKRHVDTLSSLRKAKSPPSVITLRAAVERAYGVVTDLHYFVWSSEFFKWYISQYQCLAINQRYAELRSPTAPLPNQERDATNERSIPDHQHSTEDSGDEGEDAPISDPQSDSSHESDNEDEEEEMGDFPTEFETEEDLLKSLHPLHGPPHKTYNWLRLVTSTIHHTLRFKRNTPGAAMRLDFQVIKYPMSDRMMKPWQETIAEIAGDQEIEAAMIDALCKRAAGDARFAPFLPTGPQLKFKGRAHCEAVLACLHSLAKRSQNIDWTGVPQDLMDLLKTTYSIVAPSKRCCPVCATLIAHLSHEQGAPTLQILTKHSYIFPTALPFGLPEPIRRQLIVEYKERLNMKLKAIIPAGGTSSGLSLQSQPLSVGSGDEGDETSKVAEATRNRTKRWLKSWLKGSEPGRRERWDYLKAKAPEKWARCRTELCSQQGTWEGCPVPEYVLVEGQVN